MKEYYYIGVAINKDSTPSIVGTRNHKRAMKIYNANVNEKYYLVELFTYNILLMSTKQTENTKEIFIHTMEKHLHLLNS